MKRDILLIVLGTVAVRVAVVAFMGIRDADDTTVYMAGAARWRDSGPGLLSLFASSQGRSPLAVALIAALQSRFDLLAPAEQLGERRRGGRAGDVPDLP